ncbi:uncharacterized protein BCR38DRAFT_488460 [Pseudomassariella vexata]|uniref:Uncharacterized protein n=1 Tax=Pseudomassariella vexata TaxID=1141098 RepID=A0A1Y2DLU4_9PEZI|nr:uncharacterized protein BCR38DRAFT_488460 [Pseudomassariella vexata]ORY60278.1 hypothetical protein BCR38DRAFT_488460 [Pseudomassariella vexata]
MGSSPNQPPKFGEHPAVMSSASTELEATSQALDQNTQTSIEIGNQIEAAQALTIQLLASGFDVNRHDQLKPPPNDNVAIAVSRFSRAVDTYICANLHGKDQEAKVQFLDMLLIELERGSEVLAERRECSGIKKFLTAAVQRQLDEVRKEAAELKNVVANRDEEIGYLIQGNAHMVDEIMMWEMGKVDMEWHMKTLEGDKKKMKAELEAAQKDAAKAKKELGLLGVAQKKNLSAANKARVEAAKKSERLEAEAETLRKENKRLEAKVATGAKRSGTQPDQVHDELITQKVALQRVARDLKRENEAMMKKLQELKTKEQEKDYEILYLKDDLSNINKEKNVQIELLKKNVVKKAKEKDTQTERLKQESAITTQDLEANVTHLQTNVAVQEGMEPNANLQACKYQQDNHDQRLRIIDFQNKLAQTNDQLSQTQDANKRLLGDLDAAQGRCAQGEEESHHLQTQLEDSHQEIKELRQKLLVGTVRPSRSPSPSEGRGCKLQQRRHASNPIAGIDSLKDKELIEELETRLAVAEECETGLQFWIRGFCQSALLEKKSLLGKLEAKAGEVAVLQEKNAQLSLTREGELGEMGKRYEAAMGVIVDLGGQLNHASEKISLLEAKMKN